MKLPLVKCLYTKISEIKEKGDLYEYNSNVNPLTYDFGLNVGEHYVLLGITQLNNLPYYYILSDNEVDITPAILFEDEQYNIPVDWIIKISPKDHKTLEISPKFLADIPNWFEHYMDEDEEVVSVINQAISNITQDNQLPYPKDHYAQPFEDYK